MARAFQVTFDCADPARVAAFWAEALGYRLDSPPPPFPTWEDALRAWNIPEERRNDVSALVDPDGVGPRLWFQKVPEGKTVKNRLHLDVRAAPGVAGTERVEAFEAEAERLVGLGGSILRRVEPEPPNHFFIVMADPEGNEFCID